jgi:DNA-binding SARP family transcriptional activator
VTRSVARRLVWLGWAVLLLVGLPVALTRIIEWRPPSEPRWEAWVHQPRTPGLLVATVACLGWLMWAALALAVLTDTYQVLRRAWRRLPRLHLPGSVHGLSAAVLGTVTITSTTGAAAHATAQVAIADEDPHPLPPPLRTDPDPITADAADPPALADPAHRAAGIVLAAPPRATAAGGRSSPPAAPRIYEVARGDWLGAIADRYLGSFSRYPEIRRLNPDLIPDDVGRHGPDHIEPAWRLILPGDAHDRGPRRHATGRLVATPVSPSTASHDATDGCPPPAPGGSPPAPSGPSSPAGPHTATPTRPTTHTRGVAASTPARDPDGVVTEPGIGGSAPTRTSAPAATSHPPASPSTDPPAAPASGRANGVDLPGGWVGIPLAAALIAAAAMVRLRRRHRYVPTPLGAPTMDDPDPPPLPHVVTRLRRAVRAQAPELLHPPTPDQPSVAEPADSGTNLPLPPVGPSGPDLAGLGERMATGGLGLVGPGAESAARALVVATLSSGTPADPDARGQVVIPADTLTTLLGPDAVQVGEIPRLQVTENRSGALMRAEELLIERRRLLDDYDAADLADLRAADPCHPPMPPVLLLCETPPAELRARLSTTLHLGIPLQINAVLLGAWPHGDTITVAVDGHTTGGDGQRLAVLDPATTRQLLAVLGEAHTGHRPAHAPLEAFVPAAEPTPAASEPPASLRPQTNDQAAGQDIPARLAAPTLPEPTDQPAAPTADPARERVRIRVLGIPAIMANGAPVPGLRSRAQELMVYLAVHRHGANLPDIKEALLPDATVRRAGERLQTDVGDLRRRIRDNAGNPDIQPVVNTGGRYHLNADVVEVDWWTVQDALAAASAATTPDQQVEHLRRAVAAHHGPLAQDRSYDWLPEVEEHVRRQGINARVRLADLLAGTDSHQAAHLITDATRLDPHNEDLTRRAIRAHAAVPDAQGIRDQLHRIRTALDELNLEPDPQTLNLAAQLLHQITGHPHGPSIAGDWHTNP